MRRETLEELVGTARRYGCLALVTATPPDATGYGRILRDERGHVIGVVEQKDASPDERAINEINAGIYCGPADFFREATLGLGTGNAQGEYYLTDVVARAARSIGVSAIEAAFEDVCGINDRQQLAEAEATLRGRINRALQAHVTFRDPASAVVEPDVEVGVDAELGRNVSLRGRTKIGHGARIDDGCILTDTEVGAGAHLKPYTIATDSVIGPGAIIGPFAHLRPGTRLGPDVHLGNFVETKKTVIGRGSKANHLSYLGDTTIGEKVNVGAGTITCNYDGYKKFTTVIDDGAFIGSDTQLIAPVRVGKRAVIGAGTTVTRDVPDGSLALSRVAQVERPGYADKVAERYAGPGNGASRRQIAAAKPAAAAKPRRRQSRRRRSPVRQSLQSDRPRRRPARRKPASPAAAPAERQACDVGTLTPTGRASIMSVGGPMPTSVKTFFDEKVPAVLNTSPEKVKDVAAVYLFKISGPDGGTWTVDLVSSPPTCKPGEHGTPQCTIEASDADFRGMVDGGMQAAMSLFFSGKLKVGGDPMLATKLTKLLQAAG